MDNKFIFLIFRLVQMQIDKTISLEEIKNLFKRHGIVGVPTSEVIDNIEQELSEGVWKKN